jgi:putative ATP-binding cassette transporter
LGGFFSQISVISKIINSSLVKLIQGESRAELRRMVFFSALVGITGALIIALLNQAAGLVAQSETSTFEFFAFLICLAFYVYFYRKNNHESVTSTQGMVYRFRLNIIYLVLKSDLRLFDKVSKSEIRTTINRDTQIVSQAVVSLVGVVQSCSILFFSLIYLATLSWISSILILAFLLISMSAFIAFEKTARDGLVASFVNETATFNYFDQFLSGFQEIKMSSQKANSFIHDLILSAKKTRQLRQDSQVTIGAIFSYIQVSLYFVVGMVIFLVPLLSDGFQDVVAKVATTSLFMLGSFQGVFQSIPMVINAETSAGQLLNLQKRLEDAALPIKEEDQTLDQVNTLSFDQISYQYPEQNEITRFDLGPISYAFEAGKTYFVRGSNGAGKTTFIRILLGLYVPTSGTISINGNIVNQPTNGAYRDLFAVVFSDFYLFKKLYGIGPAKLIEAKSLVQMFRLEDKVSVLDDEFDTINLSTGQRKRLALMEALLEDKPFVVLDEWAADQDPEFRRYFYQVLIPYMKKLGKTVIAISHDDKYYDCADEIITIDKGKLAKFSR